ncbi:NADH dehydrogenase [ubiquinone] 1 beta subcomplex subunit 2, mitochondrial isoform X2 [Takifugu flavidus]|uniref:NADH dehydrogenase [ubiquinone] 1 beta subcomplex subunit 2, mitochondrial isoform X2 n=1 Tax=Takifugu flavidus TaxID=433684 RepID=UPI0025443AF8|nr:NADH dehydrogenase [ubiquinone] 1 beta subcomplex subunit 2, mitochondrial isoform X2 [Takifugu flavidus]
MEKYQIRAKKDVVTPLQFGDGAGGGPHIEPQYRQYPQLTKNQKFESELLSGAMWFWILWHLWHDPDAVLGHFPWPDASQWTDEELGIPPDDEE